MSIKAMRQALEALQGGTGNTRSWHLAIEDAIIALRTAIQQAESDPVAWRAKVGDLMFHAASREGLLANLQVQFKAAPNSIEPLYTHPAPSVPDDVVRDAQRYRWLRSLEHCNEAWCFIGSGNANSNLDAAIDAAMLTAAQTQKGQP